jgi:hypothetical protein
MNPYYINMRKMAQGLSAKEGRLAQLNYWFSRPKHSTISHLPNTTDAQLAGLLATEKMNLTPCNNYSSEFAAILDEDSLSIFGSSYKHYSFHILRVSPYETYLFIYRKHDGLTFVGKFPWFIRDLFSKNLSSQNYSSWLAVQTFKFFVAEDIYW